MDDDQVRNLLLAAGLSFAVVLVWTYFLQPPPPPPAPVEQVEAPVEAPSDGVAVPQGTLVPGTSLAEAPETSQATRVAIEAPGVFGSVSLRGGRIDDLALVNYRENVALTSPPVHLLAPASEPGGYYAVYGWTAGRAGPATPGPTTAWSVLEGDVLRPGQPIRLGWDNGAGIRFERQIEVDEHFLFAVTQTVFNDSPAAVAVSPYGIVARHGTPDTLGFFILHEGPIGMFDGQLTEHDYDNLLDFSAVATEGGPAEIHEVASNGWIGFTDNYWMTALVPAANQPFRAVFKSGESSAGPVYQTDMRLPAFQVASGASASARTYLFAGAKEVATIRAYQDAFGIDRFEDAVDWGWFFFLTKPFFQILIWIQSYIGNMGISIILLTVLVKAVLFPLAYKSYAAMARMKQLQPEMEKLKERVGDDRSALQREMMALYKKEKVNPAAGCLPILLQIPIFFSLYKVLLVAIEMRHAPFVGWIRDLTAPDPTSLFNLFGLIPWTPPELLGIGFWPILMGVTMWLQMKLNPAPADPIQQKIFAWMPWVFTFMLGRFPVGLVIYWTANNVLTFIQQYTIMRVQGTEVDLLGNITGTFKRKRPGSGSKGA